jgi:hypothetical protein
LQIIECVITWLRSTIYVISELSLPLHAMLWQ